MPQLFAMNAAEGSRTSGSLASTQALSSRIATINEIAVGINQSLDLNEILKTIGKKTKWFIDFEHLSVYLIRQKSCYAKSGCLVNLFGPTLELSQIEDPNCGPIRRALKSGQPQIAYQSSDMFWPDHAIAMIIPLEQQHERFGAIIFSSTRPSAYTLDDIQVGYLLALQLSSAIQNAERFEEINRLYGVIAKEKKRSEELLLNILPHKIADELKITGKVKPVYYESASVLFTDFNGFTQLSECFTPEELVDELDICFSYFDCVADKCSLEKLKTIGDSYMCVGGVPTPNDTHAVDAVLAALEMQMFIKIRKAQKEKLHKPYWDVRIGIHSGSLMSGVIGRKKFAYDVWGDTVNTASRMESSGLKGKINVSKTTFDLVQNFFDFEYRGKILAKNKGFIDMYLVKAIRNELALDPGGFLPNQCFIDLYLSGHSESSMLEIELQKWISLSR